MASQDVGTARAPSQVKDKPKKLGDALKALKSDVWARGAVLLGECDMEATKFDATLNQAVSEMASVTHELCVNSHLIVARMYLYGLRSPPLEEETQLQLSAVVLVSMLARDMPRLCAGRKRMMNRAASRVRNAMEHPNTRALQRSMARVVATGAAPGCGCACRWFPQAS